MFSRMFLGRFSRTFFVQIQHTKERFEMFDEEDDRKREVRNHRRVEVFSNMKNARPVFSFKACFQAKNINRDNRSPGGRD